MLFVGDIPGSSADMILAVRIELLSEVSSVDKMLVGGEGRRGVVGIDSVVDFLGLALGFVVLAELVFFVPTLVLSADITEAVPMLAVGEVLIVFSR